MSVKLVAMIALVLVAGSMLRAAESPVNVPTADKVLETLVVARPRLVLTDRRLAELKKLAAADKLLAKSVGDVIRQADGLARRPVLV